ncbi:hypothetical protein GWK47_044879 [Chionoecetes opilio]|uniref:Uncharacterized protein n=1 Tax=Chionoecetes opilio TaxID=41210 RepID=A0A8J5CI39_CHIOP|nr:hypothetical protein GWK47_044879 [Chionoecetes opilio]
MLISRRCLTQCIVSHSGIFCDFMGTLQDKDYLMTGLYYGTDSAVKCGESVSSFFPVNAGVRQREETANVIDATNRQLGDITAWGRRWQVKFTAEKTQAMVISRLREDTRLLEGKLKFGDDTLAIKDSINTLRVEVDSRLSFDRHLETEASRASLRVTLLRRVRHLLEAHVLMKLYKAKVRPVMQYSPPTCMIEVPPVTAGQSAEAC